MPIPTSDRDKLIEGQLAGAVDAPDPTPDPDVITRLADLHHLTPVQLDRINGYSSLIAQAASTADGDGRNILRRAAHHLVDAVLAPGPEPADYGTYFDAVGRAHRQIAAR